MKNSIAPEILGKMLVLQAALQVAPDEKRLGEMLCAGLLVIPGLRSTALYLSENLMASSSVKPDIVQEWPALQPENCERISHDADRFVSLSVQTNKAVYGCLVFSLSDPSLFDPYLPHLENTAHLVALMIENRRQAATLRTCNASLEDQVRDRVKALQESEQRIRQMSDASGAYLWEVNPNLVYTYISDLSLNAKGYLPADLLGHTPMEFMPAEDVDPVGEIVNRAIAGKTSFSVQHRNISKTGEILWEEVHGATYEDEQGNVVGLRGTGLNITERKQAEEALRENEVHFRTLADSGQALIWTSGTDKKCDYFNQPWLTFTGRALEQELGDGWAEGVHPDDLQRCVEIYVRAFDRREIFSMDYRIRHASSEYRWIQDDGSPRYSSKGEFIGYIGHCLDITERKRAERVVQLSEYKYSTIFSLIPDMVGITRMADGLFIEVNNGFEQGTGWKREEAIGKSSLELGVWSHEARAEAVAIMQKKGHLYEYEFMMTTKSGAQRNALMYLLPIVLQDEKCLFFMARDVTDRKQAEEALRASERRFRELIRNSSDSVTILDKNGTQIYVSDVVEKMLGYTPSELIHIPVIREMIHPDDQESFQTAFQRILHEGHGGAHYRHRHKNGSWVYLEAWGTNQLENPDIRGVVINVRDITERKKAAEEREKLQAQLTQAQKMESVGRLAGGVAHDFNNKLGVIIGSVDLALIKLEAGHPLVPGLKEIRKAARSSADLTRQLLAFARKQTVTPRVLDLNETVSGMLTMLGRLIGEDIKLSWLPGAGLWPVNMDPGQIDQLLANICINARDAIGGIGMISIATETAAFDASYCNSHPGHTPGDYVSLIVSDTGCGMDAETQANIFEPFFTTKEVGKGTGLGLATVYGIVTQNSGFINVYSEPGIGTTFRIYLPRYLGKSEQIQKESQEEPATRGNETILLVEDESAILNVTTMLIESMGYKVLAAATPGEAMRLAREHAGNIHLLMTDVVMPEMNGRDLAKNLLSLYPEMKRLFMSGYTADIIANHGILDAGVDFIQKPFSMAELADKVRKTLER